MQLTPPIGQLLNCIRESLGHSWSLAEFFPSFFSQIEDKNYFWGKQLKNKKLLTRRFITMHFDVELKFFNTAYPNVQTKVQQN